MRLAARAAGARRRNRLKLDLSTAPPSVKFTSTWATDFAARDMAHAREIVDGIRALPNMQVIEATDIAVLLHEGGKLSVNSKLPLKTQQDLSLAYTPGVARVCTLIKEQPDAVWSLTGKRNTVAVVTDGSAVLGLGNLGPRAALPRRGRARSDSRSGLDCG